MGPFDRAIRSAWRRLPKWGRRRIFDAASRLSPVLGYAPQLDLTDRRLPRIVAGFLSSPSGLGQSARLAARALTECGYTVLGIDLSRYFYEEAGVVDFALADGRRVGGPGHVIAVINAPYLPYALGLLGRGFLRDKHVTAYWAWELSRAPASWRKGLGSAHDIAVPSQFVAEAIGTLEPLLPVRIAPHPAVLDALAPSFHLAGSRRPDQPFTVLGTLSIGSGFARKNPLDWIAAFKLAFGRRADCRLRLLATNAEHFPPAKGAIEKAIDGAQNIEVRWVVSNREDYKRWCGTPDVCLSLHRAEGFGLPLAEAMCAGYPMVATGWSGNMQFMTAENSFPVGYRLVAVDDAQGKYPADLGAWAEADVEEAARILQVLEKRPEQAREIGLAAARSTRAMLGAESFSRALLGRPAVRESSPWRGEVGTPRT